MPSLHSLHSGGGGEGIVLVHLHPCWGSTLYNPVVHFAWELAQHRGNLPPPLAHGCPRRSCGTAVCGCVAVRPWFSREDSQRSASPRRHLGLLDSVDRQAHGKACTGVWERLPTVWLKDLRQRRKPEGPRERQTRPQEPCQGQDGS